MKKWLFITIAVLVGALYLAVQQIRESEEKWKTAMANVKAYDSELSAEKKQGRAYQLTIEQLRNSNDSILGKLNETRKELKVRDSKLNAMQYVSSDFTRTDTITLRDTIFREPSFVVDTLIGDGWYNVRVGLRYPSLVAVSPWFRSEKHVVVYSRRETVNPPKKFFLFRWFQKKHTVVQFEVVEKNPYIGNEYSKYIEIVR